MLTSMAKKRPVPAARELGTTCEREEELQCVWVKWAEAAIWCGGTSCDRTAAAAAAGWAARCSPAINRRSDRALVLAGADGRTATRTINENFEREPWTRTMNENHEREPWTRTMNENHERELWTRAMNENHEQRRTVVEYLDERPNDYRKYTRTGKYNVLVLTRAGHQHKVVKRICINIQSCNEFERKTLKSN
jgi:hypothetical protein